MPARFCLIPAVYVLLRRHVDGDRQVLLQYRSGTGFMDDHWAAGAAGHVEAGESIFQAACREAAEELGIGLVADNLVPLTVVHRRHEDDDPVNQRVDFWFAADEWEGNPTTQEVDKSTGLEWVSLTSLPDPVVPHERAVLTALSSGDLVHIGARGFGMREQQTAP